MADETATADGSLFFDGAFVHASTTGTAPIIFIKGRTVCDQDVDRTLAIRGGKNFIIGAYRVRSVNVKSNSWTLDRNCSDGAGSQMSGISGRQSGKWHEPVREFYESGVPNNPGRGEARQSVLVALNHFCPEILNTLAERCLRDEFLHLRGSGKSDWSDGPDELQWGHVGGANHFFFSNLVPLKAAIEDWASDTPLNRWNLCGKDGALLEWIGAAAVQTLVYWYQQGKLPRVLKWENLDLFCYGGFHQEMFELERNFDAGSGLLKISPPDEEPEAEKLPDRAQRVAKRRYKQLGEKLELTRIKSIGKLHLVWYVLHTFLGWTPRRIDLREREQGRLGGSPGDVSRISQGIKTVAVLVGFSRRSGPK